MQASADPARHVVVYRSAWNVRILLSGTPWTAEQIATVRKFCDDRSFDVSYYPGIDVAAARANIYNDLPAVSFDAGEVESSAGSQDAIADEAEAVLRGQPSRVAGCGVHGWMPATLDRPAYYDVLRLAHLGTILKRLEILPQAEIGQLVNLAVLAQAVVIAMRWCWWCRCWWGGGCGRRAGLCAPCCISRRWAWGSCSSRSP